MESRAAAAAAIDKSFGAASKQVKAATNKRSKVPSRSSATAARRATTQISDLPERFYQAVVTCPWCPKIRRGIFRAAVRYNKFLVCVSRFSSTRRIISPRSISRLDMVTNPFGMSPPMSTQNAAQRGHFYLGRRGHLNLGATRKRPITSLMTTTFSPRAPGGGSQIRAFCYPRELWHLLRNRLGASY